jgi:hypothetical protein
MSNFYKEYDHSPTATLDYGFDWRDKGWLEDTETIALSVWAASTGITLTQEQSTLGVTSVFASGGVAGRLYTLTNTITTSQGRVDSRTIQLSCKVR